MSRARIPTIMAVAGLMLTLVSCNATNGDQERTATPTAPDTVPTVLTVPGSTDRVTDVASIEISEEERQFIEEKCTLDAPIAGTGESCIPLVTGGPCGKVTMFCVIVGRVLGEPDVGFLQVQDRQPGQPTCHDGIRDELCQGITVHADIVAPLIETASTSTSLDATTSPSAPTITESDATPTTDLPTVTPATDLPTVTTPTR